MNARDARVERRGGKTIPPLVAAHMGPGCATRAVLVRDPKPVGSMPLPSQLGNEAFRAEGCRTRFRHRRGGAINVSWAELSPAREAHSLALTNESSAAAPMQPPSRTTAVAFEGSAIAAERAIAARIGLHRPSHAAESSSDPHSHRRRRPRAPKSPVQAFREHACRRRHRVPLLGRQGSLRIDDAGPRLRRSRASDGVGLRSLRIHPRIARTRVAPHPRDQRVWVSTRKGIRGRSRCQRLSGQAILDAPFCRARR